MLLHYIYCDSLFILNYRMYYAYMWNKCVLGCFYWVNLLFNGEIKLITSFPFEIINIFADKYTKKWTDMWTYIPRPTKDTPFSQLSPFKQFSSSWMCQESSCYSIVVFNNSFALFSGQSSSAQGLIIAPFSWIIQVVYGRPTNNLTWVNYVEGKHWRNCTISPAPKMTVI